MSFHSWLQNLRSALAPRRGQRHRGRQGSLRAATYQPNLEALEERITPSLSPAWGFPVSGGAVTVGDFTSDGIPDLATSGGDLLLGNGYGGFVAGRPFAGGGRPAADFNNDRNLDLVMVGSGQVSVLPGNGNGTFRPPVQTAILPD